MIRFQGSIYRIFPIHILDKSAPRCMINGFCHRRIYMRKQWYQSHRGPFSQIAPIYDSRVLFIRTKVPGALAGTLITNIVVASLGDTSPPKDYPSTLGQFAHSGQIKQLSITQSGNEAYACPAMDYKYTY